MRTLTTAIKKPIALFLSLLLVLSGVISAGAVSTGEMATRAAAGGIVSDVKISGGRFDDGTTLGTFTAARSYNTIVKSASLNSSFYGIYNGRAFKLHEITGTSSGNFAGFCIDLPSTGGSDGSWSSDLNNAQSEAKRYVNSLNSMGAGDAISLVIACGYGGDYPDEQTLNTSRASRVASFMATQAIVWEITGGVRNYTYPYSIKSGEQSYRDAVRPYSVGSVSAAEMTSQFKAAYDLIINRMKAMNENPFTSGKTTMKWNDQTKRYEGTITAKEVDGITYDYRITGSSVVKIDSVKRSGGKATIKVSSPNEQFSESTALTVDKSISGLEGKKSSMKVFSSFKLSPGQVVVAGYATFAPTLSRTNIGASVKSILLQVRKSSANPELTAGSDCYTLAGAKYGIFTDSKCTNRIGTIVTDENGRGIMNNGNGGTVPVGTYYAKEDVAPPGYALNTTPIKFTDSGENTQKGTDIFTATHLETPQNDPVAILLNKVDENGEPLENAEFTISYYKGFYDTKAEIEEAVENGVESRSWVFRTDEDGYASLSDEKDSDGNYKYFVSGDEFYYQENEAGEKVIVFPLGTVVIQETKAPEGYKINESNNYFIRHITDEGDAITVSTYNAPTIPNSPDLELKTTAKDKATGSSSGFVSSSTTIVDTVSYNGLTVGEEYTLEGVLMDKSTGKELTVNGKTVTATKTFTPTAMSGSVDMEFTFNSSALVGKSVVVFEYLYLNGKEVISHADINDKGQTVTFADVAIGTQAKFSTGVKSDYVDEQTEIVDTVTYQGLQSSTQYTLEGVLMDKSTGKELTVNGKTVTATRSFTPTAANGTVDVEFNLDSTSLKGKSVVVYERLYSGSTLIASHTNINDEGQTVTFADPSLSTRAWQDEWGTNTGYAVTSGSSPYIHIRDDVTFSNLIPNREYTLKSVLVDKSTGEAVYSNTRTLTAKSSSFSGNYASCSFDISKQSVSGKSYVWYEYLYYGDKEIASHADINDEGQTINFVSPSITTKARDTSTDSNTAYVGEKTTIVDTVSYENVIPGVELTIRGTLYDANNRKVLLVDGEQVTAETTFVPNSSSGTENVVFEFDSSDLKGVDVVVFETMYYNNGSKDTIVANHRDYNDPDQTVGYLEPVITTTAKDKDSQTQVGYAVENAVVVDTVAYENVIPGVELTIKGTLMDKATGEALVVAGNEVTAEMTFTPDSSSGTVDVEYNLNATDLDGKSVVVFEQLYYGDILMAAHEDINDEGQTVSYKNPTIGTTAKDSVTGGSFAYVSEQSTIIDTVKYSGLLVGKEHTISGVLMDKTTGEPLVVNGETVTAAKTFTPTTANGSIDMEFTFDSSALQDKSVVVFETLLYNSQEIASHADINDGGQTVTFKNPSVSTTATDKETGNHEGYAGDTTTIVDKVELTGLIVGESYTVDGVLMDKSTGAELLIDGKTVTASKTFEATAESMTVEMEFTFDSSALVDTDVVVFEDLKYKDLTIAYHRDIDDGGQTVTIIGKGDIYVVKTDDKGEPLEGVVFGLYNDKECTSEAVDVNGTAYGELTTDENGFVEFNDIRYGTYYLSELKTVNGYQLLIDVVEVVVDKDGTRYYYGGGELTDIISAVNADDETVKAVNIPNSPTPQFPNAGGIERIIWFTVGAAVIILGAALLFINIKRKKKGCSGND